MKLTEPVEVKINSLGCTASTAPALGTSCKTGETRIKSDFTGKFPPAVLKFSILTPYLHLGIHNRLTGPCHSLYHLSELFSASIILPFQKNSDQITLLYTTECNTL